MIGRGFNKKVEIWAVDQVSDGFGGYTVAETKISDSWAKVETLQPGKVNNVKTFGLEDAQNAVLFTMRKRNDITYNEEIHFLKYRGRKFTISTAPANVNFEDRVIVFVGTMEPVKANSIVLTIIETSPVITVV